MNRASILAGISGHGLRIVSSRWKEIMPPGLTLPAFLRDLSRGFLVFLLRTMDPGLWRIARAKRMTKDGEMDRKTRDRTLGSFAVLSDHHMCLVLSFLSPDDMWEGMMGTCRHWRTVFTSTGYINVLAGPLFSDAIAVALNMPAADPATAGPAADPATAGPSADSQWAFLEHNNTELIDLLEDGNVRDYIKQIDAGADTGDALMDSLRSIPHLSFRTNTIVFGLQGIRDIISAESLVASAEKAVGTLLDENVAGDATRVFAMAGALVHHLQGVKVRTRRESRRLLGRCLECVYYEREYYPPHPRLTPHPTHTTHTP
jgi:hypothetical protein